MILRCIHKSAILSGLFFAVVGSAQPPDLINLEQAKALGFEVTLKHMKNEPCADLTVFAPKIDPVNPEYSDVYVSLMFFKNDQRVQVMSLKNHEVIRDKQVVNQLMACFPADLFDEVLLTIKYEAKTDKQAELQCLKEHQNALHCTSPFVCHTNWQLKLSHEFPQIFDSADQAPQR